MEVFSADLRAKSLEALEWPRLLDRLAERALSHRGEQACREIHLASTLQGARRAIDETAEMVELLRDGGSVPLGRFEDVEDIAFRCSKGSTVKPEELHEIASLLELARLARGFFKNLRMQCPLLWERAQSIEELADLKFAVARAVDDAGRIKENATPELKRRLQSLRDKRAVVVTRIEEFMHREHITSYLQDDYYTQRGNRYVLPVKTEHRPHIEGIVHDSSQSGQTLYIEPREFIDANNRLKMAELEVDQEVERIVRELVEMVASATDKLRIDLEILTELDVIYAKARLALELDASVPELNGLGVINLRNVKHPHLVLQPEEVVPNDLSIDRELDALVISGANTGGKTVMLKTIGLCALMARAGMLIPTDPESEMAVFTDVWADIGDEQNIEEHLSTFSGHILNIIGILENARHGSIVLLDELVTSTDPNEGSALAEAILHHLAEQGAKIVATTHYTQLKAYARAHSGFDNAGVEFDSVSLKPTYRLIQGVPGRSSALEIAGRLGMETSVIKRAHELIDDSDLRIEELLASLEKDRSILDSQQRDFEVLLKSLEDKKIEQTSLREKLKEQERNFRRNVKKRVADEIENARNEIKEIMASLNREKSGKAADHARKKLSGLEDKYSDLIPAQGEPAAPENLKAGDEVVVAHLGVTGVLIDDAAGKNKVRVRIGQAPMVVPVENLLVPSELNAQGSRLNGNQPAIRPVRVAPAAPGSNVGVSVSEHAPSISLDLRGFRTDDALDEVDRFLDKSAIANIAQVEIIHGHGTGTLKKFIRNHLEKSPYVASWKPAGIERGGDGVTLVNLKLGA